jgi:hypothetical protein
MVIFQQLFVFLNLVFLFLLYQYSYNQHPMEMEHSCCSLLVFVDILLLVMNQNLVLKDILDLTIKKQMIDINNTNIQQTLLK